MDIELLHTLARIGRRQLQDSRFEFKIPVDVIFELAVQCRPANMPAVSPSTMRWRPRSAKADNTCWRTASTYTAGTVRFRANKSTTTTSFSGRGAGSCARAEPEPNKRLPARYNIKRLILDIKEVLTKVSKKSGRPSPVPTLLFTGLPPAHTTVTIFQNYPCK